MKINIKPTKKQHQAWQYLQDDKTNYILFGGGAGSGKSFLSAQWLLMMATTFAGTRYFLGRSELKAIRSSWLQTFYKVIRDSGFEPSQIFKLNAVDWYLQFPNSSRIDLLDLKDEPSDPYFERLGSFEFTSGAIEEAGEVSGGAFDMLKSRIGRCNNHKYNLTPKILMTCNPKKNWIYTDFYKPFKEGTLPLNMAVVLANVDDNHYVPEYKHMLLSISDKRQRERLLGSWEYDLTSQGLIQFEAIVDAFSGVVDAKIKGGSFYITADIARFGSDNTVVMLWQGNRVLKIQVFGGLATTQTVEKIKSLKAQYSVSVSNIILDADGIGGGVADMIPGAKQFVNNSRPLPVNGIEQNFTNLKTQCYVKLSELINEREIFITCDHPTIKNQLIEELEQVRLKDSEGKLAVIPKSEVKEAIGRSPDISDALMMKMMVNLQPQGHYHVQTFTPRDHREKREKNFFNY